MHFLLKEYESTLSEKRRRNPVDYVSTYPRQRTWDQRKAMKNMAKALWPSDVPPESMVGLADLLKAARRRFELWKTLMWNAT